MKAREPKDAMFDMRENLSSVNAINDAIRRIQAFDESNMPELQAKINQSIRDMKQTQSGMPEHSLVVQATKDARNSYDFLQFMFSDDFSLDKHFPSKGKGNNLRFYGTLASSFNEDNLAKNGITRDICAANDNPDTMRKVIMLASVISSLEEQYLRKNPEIMSEKQQAIANDRSLTSEQQIEKIQALKDSYCPISRQGQRYNNLLAECMIKLADVPAILELRKQIFQSPLPDNIKKIGLETVELIISDKSIKNDERSSLTESVLQYFAHPTNEANRSKLVTESEKLKAPNDAVNSNATKINSNLFALSISGYKAPKSNPLFSPKTEKTAPVDSPGNSPRNKG